MESGARGWLMLGMCTTVVAVAFEVMAVNTAMPAAAQDLGGLAFYAWAFSAFLVGMVFATAVSGRLSDARGPRVPVAGGLAVFVVGLIIAGLAPTMGQLVVGRFVQGLGSGLVNTALFVLIAQVFSERERARVFTFISTAWLMPSFLGPPLSAWVTETWSWHWAFLSVVPVALAGGAAAVDAPRRTSRRPGPGRHRQPRGAAAGRPRCWRRR